ncbi:LysR family transcriptional regulator [Rhizobium tropici]|uniref:LysR family transcriptional regulator n=1 Tax=Rhizobium tropici TaxID=398 RepID=A0A5B0WAP4_RHITR|nr:LysR family transcriptional regulator [Rhizobium tropici]KAA1183953.1 LysR family transcriptional regulator [Rhizobium tropici]
MKKIDLNLLIALDVLLEECSVLAAAKRLGLSPSATSRTLARLRDATGDPILVQAGRSLVPTPHAEQLAGRLHALVQEAQSVLTPVLVPVDPGELERVFTIRANEGFVALFAPAIIAVVAKEAPRVRLHFAPKPDKDTAPLRQGTIDLDIGTTGSSAPEVRSHLLFRDRFIGVVRSNHPLLDEPVTPERYVSHGHVVTSRRGLWHGPVDDALLELGLQRDILAVVPSFSDALNVARHSDLIALVPSLCLGDVDSREKRLQSFALPVSTPEVTISAMWHPRLDADPEHRWLRQKLIATCRTMLETGPRG